MNRGEIWTAAGGADYAGKPRPVAIVQGDRFETASITVCAFTSHAQDAPLFRVTVEPDGANGLNAVSHLMADKITTIPRSKLGRRVGRLGSADMARLDRALMVFLGLAG